MIQQCTYKQSKYRIPRSQLLSQFFEKILYVGYDLEFYLTAFPLKINSTETHNSQLLQSHIVTLQAHTNCLVKFTDLAQYGSCTASRSSVRKKIFKQFAKCGRTTLCNRVHCPLHYLMVLSLQRCSRFSIRLQNNVPLKYNCVSSMSLLRLL